ncbi:MAG TPA: DedA family protein [Methylomirabilota bacterium]|jgi:membrane protein DedA with SNARE-associated domain
MEILRPLFDWLVDHTYLVVFIGTVIDATGLPFPGRLLLAGAGAVAAAGHANVAVVIAVGALGAILVDQAWYVTVTRGSNWLIDMYCRMRGRERNCSDDAIDYFRRYGGVTIILGRFFTVVRVLVWPVAASHGLGYGRFVVLDVVGASIWASMWVLLGWFVGEQWEWAAKSVGGWTAGVGIVIALALALPVALRLWRRRGYGHGGPRNGPPYPPKLGTPRQSRDAPR